MGNSFLSRHQSVELPFFVRDGSPRHYMWDIFCFNYSVPWIVKMENELNPC